MDSYPRHTVLRGTAAVVVAVLLVACAGLTLGYEPPQLGAGTIKDPADGTTAVAVQGFHFQGEGSEKKPARLLRVNETGGITELANGTDTGTSWFYDVDPLDDGNLLVTSTLPGTTLAYELNPETGERVWEQEFDAEDTHDVAMLNEHELLVANMRNGGGNGEVSNDRLFVYNLTSDEVVWEWYFKNHYPESTDGGMNADWSHVNDVDKIEEGRYLVSPRNFDQAIVVNRSTKEIEMRLGEDDNHSILNEQHNPDYLESDDGTPTMLVADSDNDRIVEYERDCGDADPGLGAGTPPDECHWNLVWELGDQNMSWPRDADRLPNGNTLITDSLNHRVVEVTPSGEIVWEVNTPWGPYDAERVKYGPESNGPTMRDQGVNGSFPLQNAEPNNATVGTGSSGTEGTSFPVWIQQTTAGWPGEAAFDEFAETWEGVSQWVKPVWMAPWGFVALVGALVLSVGWLLAELVYNRQRVYRRVTSLRSARTE
ncbi:aryl-sulfate sulfotransferase [Halobacteria archaeon HArc-gm2]|nr:aryl-sulfate sulfotransferase [Halobacteria archaeon HArc-gm2]